MSDKILAIILFFNFLTLNAVTPYYRIRSQSEDTARELVGAGWNTYINQMDMQTWYTNLSITPEYTRSFRPYRIGQYLFDRRSLYDSCNTYYSNVYSPCNTMSCDEDITTIRIYGSQANGKTACDWLADYFGLPTDYKSYVTFEPRIENALVDFNLYIGLDRLIEGLYFRIHSPVVYTKWNLNMCECIENQGSNNHWPGYFSSALSASTTGTIGISRNQLGASFTSFIMGCTPAQMDNITFYPLCYAKMDCRPQTKTALSDIHMALGWNFWLNEDYHLGFNLRTVVPTGNKPKALYLFEPIVGNSGHWEAGVGFSGHVVLSRSLDDKKRWEFYGDANLTHLFKAKQCRTFDLCNKPLSRYMLAAQFSKTVNNLYASDADDLELPEDPQAPLYQFNGIYEPVANLTTCIADVSIDFQVDLALMFQHVHGNWSFDLGYNFWGQSCEKIDINYNCCPLTKNNWGLKGDAFMYGFVEDLDGNITSEAVPLSATQSNATIYNGLNNWPNGINGIEWAQNPGIDNPKLAWSAYDDKLLIYDVVATTTRQVYTSLNPVLINFSNIDKCSAQTKGLSHKIFTHFDYTWRDHEDSIPYIGIGGEIEFGDYNIVNDCYQCNSNIICSSVTASSNSACSTYNPCLTSCGDSNSSCCNSCALSQWGVWLKGGFTF